MHFQDIVDTMVAVWERNPKQAIYVEGPPGVGKTSLMQPLAERLNVPEGNTHIFRPSIKEPSDLCGVPSVVEGVTQWNPPPWLHRLQKGRHILCIDELPQGVKMMQNACAGLMLDRFLDEVKLSDEVFVFSTGNKTEHKAGANKVVSQLANRVMRLEAEVAHESFENHGLEQGWDPMLLAFHRFKSGALLDFDPDRFSNATPRTWEMVWKSVPTDLPPHQFLAAVSGLVGEGYAAEYMGFLRLANKLPSIDAIVMDPANAEIPEEPEIRYVCVATLATRTTKDNFSSLQKYVERLPVDFQVLFMKSVAKVEGVLNTKEFISWASKNKSVFL